VNWARAVLGSAIVVLGGCLSAAPSASESPPASPTISQRPNDQLTPSPSPTTEPTPEPTPSDEPAATDASCFLSEPDATPAPAPLGSPDTNPELLGRLPAQVLGVPTDRNTLSGRWALSASFYSSMARGFLACTGADVGDLWMGIASGSNTRGTVAMAVEVDGVSGAELQRIFVDGLLRPFGDVTLEPREHAGRSYQRVNQLGMVYATERTFYYIASYCCVDESRDSPDPATTPPPTVQQIMESMLEGLPSV